MSAEAKTTLMAIFIVQLR